MSDQRYTIELNEEQLQLLIELSGSLSANLNLLKITSNELKELRTKLLDTYQIGWKRKVISPRLSKKGSVPGFYWETEA